MRRMYLTVVFVVALTLGFATIALASLESGFYAGTPQADTIRAGDGPNTVWGKSGNDTIYGGGGNDRLYGQIGNDRLYGQDGEDVLVGGSGNDFLDGGDDAVADDYFGGMGTDTCVLNGKDNSSHNKTNCDIVVH